MQHQLQVNVQDKEVALAIDTVCHQMNNFSRGLQHYAGIEKYDRRWGNTNLVLAQEIWSFYRHHEDKANINISRHIFKVFDSASALVYAKRLQIRLAFVA